MKSNSLTIPVVLCSLVGIAAANIPDKALPFTGKPTPPITPPTHMSYLVGGSDSCTTPDMISGQGTFAVDNTLATAGSPIGSCGLMNKDVWFAWTPTVSGDADVTLCGGIGTADSVLAAWTYAGAGVCPSTQIVCDDDSACGLQSEITIPGVVAGSTYMLEFGSYNTTAGYAGTFTVTVSPPPVPPPNDDCSAPIAITGSGSFPFDIRLATTGTQGQAEALCNFYSQTGIGKDAWWTWTPSMTGTATLTDCGLTNPVASDTKVAIYDGAGCPVAAAIACNDDQGYPPTTTCAAYVFNSTVTWPTVCGQSYTIQLGNYPLNTGSFMGTFAISETGTTCAPPAIGYCFGDGSGTACPCGNAGTTGNGCGSSVNANGANMTASGSSSLAGDTLVLSGTGMPNSTCLYFQGNSRANAGLGAVFGDGLRCATGGVKRLGTKTNAAGASQYPVGADAPISVKGAVTVAGTKDYQCWYRNAAAFCTVSTFNLSNGLEVTWF